LQRVIFKARTGYCMIECQSNSMVYGGTDQPGPRPGTGIRANATRVQNKRARRSRQRGSTGILRRRTAPAPAHAGHMTRQLWVMRDGRSVWTHKNRRPLPGPCPAGTAKVHAGHKLPRAAGSSPTARFAHSQRERYLRAGSRWQALRQLEGCNGREPREKARVPARRRSRGQLPARRLPPNA
jgi:hypothetical protein